MRGATYTSGQQRQVLRVFPELVHNRELLLDLVTKDLRVRYRYALMGFLWAILEPLAMTLVLYFVFGMVFQFRGGGTAPYAVSLLCGLVFWQFLARSLGTGVRSLIDNQNLVSKVYFPRETIPLAAVGVNLFNLLIGFVILLVLLLLTGTVPGVHALWLLPIFAVQLALVVGLVLLLSSLNVFFRDVSYITDVALVLGFYATPIFYDYRTDVLSLAAGHPWLVKLYALNPMVGIVTAYREALLENVTPSWPHLAWPAVAAVLALGAGVVVFRRKAGQMADYL